MAKSDRYGIQNTVYRLWESGRRAVTSERARRYRSWLFQAYILIAILAFSLLAFLADTFDYLALDLRATLALQRNTPPAMRLILEAVSWPGYAPQTFVLVAIIVIALSIMGLRWEAVAALFTAFITATLNYIVKTRCSATSTWFGSG